MGCCESSENQVLEYERAAAERLNKEREEQRRQEFLQAFRTPVI